MPPRRRRSPASEGEPPVEVAAAPQEQSEKTSEEADSVQAAEVDEATASRRTRRRRKSQPAQIEAADAAGTSAEPFAPTPSVAETEQTRSEATALEVSPPEVTPKRRRGQSKKEKASETPAEAAPLLPAPVDRSRILPAPLSLLEIPPPQPPQETPARRTRTRRRPPEVTAAPRTSVRIGVRQGNPEIILNGQVVAPLFNFVRVDWRPSQRVVEEQVRNAAATGIHLHILPLELTASVEQVNEAAEEARWWLRWLRQHDPQGYGMLRVMFRPPADWQRRYPDAVTTYADGSTGDPSFASDAFWQEAQDALSQLVRQLEESEEEAYLLGYHIDYGEWFYDYHRGYDYSPAAQEAFRQWLRGRYRNDIVALRAAWHDSAVTFTSASVPPETKKALTVLYESRKGQRYVDYLRFASEVVARRIVALSRAVKRSCENRRLVAVSYGYLLELPVPHSGHLALAEVLSAQSIDMLIAPLSFRSRLPGQGGLMPLPVASVRLHGKLFVMEDDTKPHSATEDTPDDFNPRCPDAEATYNIRLRNAANALVQRSGIAWMDPWGKGWLSEAEMWRQIQPFSHIYQSPLRARLADPPEVAVIIDEQSLTRVQCAQELIQPLLQQQEILARAGIHYGVYLQSDLVRKAFPDTKLYIFLNPIQVDSEVRAAIRERLQRDGKTLVWLYAVALYDEQGYTPDGPRDVAGIAIKAQPWNSEMGTIISNDRHPISERLRHKQFGVRERINPSFYVIDEGVEVLGEYIQTGLPSVAVKELSQWRSVFVGERQLTVDLLRGICRYAGVTVWSQSSDFVQVAPPLVAIHSVGDGTVQLQFPQRSYVYDLLGDRLLAQDALSLRLGVRLAQSGLYAVGTYEQLSELGLSLPEPQQPRSLHPTEGVSSGKKRRKRSGKRHRKRK